MTQNLFICAPCISISRFLWTSRSQVAISCRMIADRCPAFSCRTVTVFLGLALVAMGASSARASEGDAPSLVPGGGWSGATAQPSAVGSPSARGYDCEAIARFDVVPWQTFDGLFGVGVVAFHMHGIERVDFSVDNGPWTSVYEMTLNPRTGVWEYWANLDASSFSSDGEVIVRAIVYPNDGIPRVLQESTGHLLQLYANGGGTLVNTGVAVHVAAGTGSDSTGDGSEAQPFATWARGIKHLNNTNGSCEGATIYLHEGTYSYSDDTSGDGAPNRWLTTTRAPGVAREDVVLSGTGSGVLQRRIHVKEVTLNHSVDNGLILRLRSGPYGNKFWIEGCDVYGLGFIGESTSSSFVNAGSQGPVYYTELDWHDSTAVLTGPLIRNINGWNLGGDFLVSRGLMVNCYVDHMRFNSGVHPDVYQVSGGPNDNIILFNIMATDMNGQGLNIGQGASLTNNLAIVNCLIEQLPAAAGRNFLPAAGSGTSKHVLIWHHTTVGITTDENSGGQDDFDVIGSSWSNLRTLADPSGWFLDQNHYETSSVSKIGSNYTTGNPNWVTNATWNSAGNAQVSAGDYRPATGSPLADRMEDLLVPVDVLNRPRSSPTAVGAMIAEDETVVEPSYWCGYSIDENNYVNTGDFMGWLFVFNPTMDAGWVWPYLLDKYVYIRNCSEVGAWAYLPK